MFSSELWQKSGVSTYSIDQSIRFDWASITSGSYMHKTYSGAGDRTSWTWSCWFKLGSLNGFTTASNYYYALFSCDSSTSDAGRGMLLIIADSGVEDAIKIQFQGHSTVFLKTTRQFRDPSAWYHITLVWDSDNSMASERARLYINGQRETSFTTQNNPTSGQEIGINLAAEHRIGGTKNLSSSALNYPWDGYMADIHFLDGYSYGPEYFGETTSNGLWIPKEYDGSYGSNGFKIDGRDSSDLGDDESGRGNDYTTSGHAAHDQVLDSPTNNFAVYNVLYNVGDVDLPTYSESNLSVDFNYFGKRSPVSTFALPTDSDAYCEFYIKTSASSAHNSGVGIGQGDANNAGNVALTNGVTYNFNGYKHTGDGTATTFGNTYTAGDIIGVYFDQSDNEVDFYKNNTLEGSLSLSSYSGDLFFLVANNTTSQQVIVANFGQDDTFAGNKTSGSAGASDSSGNGKFYYTRISGAKALCSKSLGS